METELAKIGLNPKEIRVYLYLVEYGVSGAFEIAKHLWLPKSSVHFLADGLWKRWLIRKSIRGITSYYEADISLLESSVAEEVSEKNRFLEETVPKLREKNARIKSVPKIVFFDGLEHCKQAYLELLKTKHTFYEFWAHGDLVGAFGTDFMDRFVVERIRRNIFCDAVASSGEIEKSLKKLDTEQLRDIALFSESYGSIGSSIAIYGDKVLILNLRGIEAGVCIENADFAETMKTIFRICKGTAHESPLRYR